jgi:hypothetical protein
MISFSSSLPNSPFSDAWGFRPATAIFTGRFIRASVSAASSMTRSTRAFLMRSHAWRGKVDGLRE